MKKFLIFFMVFLLSACFENISQADKEFQEKIKSSLLEDGDSVMVSDIHAGDWSEVCPVIGYERASQVASAALKSAVTITNTRDEVASDDVWGFLFLYPPNQAEYLRVNEFYQNIKKGCVSKKVAQFVLVAIGKTRKLGLGLIENAKIIGE